MKFSTVHANMVYKQYVPEALFGRLPHKPGDKMIRGIVLNFNSFISLSVSKNRAHPSRGEKGQRGEGGGARSQQRIF